MNTFSSIGGGMALGALFGVMIIGHPNEATLPFAIIATVLQAIGIFSPMFDGRRR